VRFTLVLLALISAAAQTAEPLRRNVGRYEVSVRLPAEGLVAGEENQVEFLVLDTRTIDPATNAPPPVVRARIRGVVDMPEMPGMAKFDEIAHSEGIPGVYGVHPTFPHGGAYRLRISLLPREEQTLGISPPDPEPFSVEFPLTVADTRGARRSAAVVPFSLEVVSSPKAPREGEPIELALRILLENTVDRRPATAFDLAHEKLMHLFLVRSDLGAFAHEHPSLGDDGVFNLRHTFPSAGRWMVFADVAPKGAGSQILRGRVVVRGVPFEAFDLAREEASGRALADATDGVVAELRLPPDRLPTRRTVTLTASLKDAAGRSVDDLETYLGAMGHLMAIHEDGQTFVHSHPDEREPGTGRDGRIPFLARFPKPGLYRAWLQFQRSGRVHTARFVLHATDPGEP